MKSYSQAGQDKWVLSLFEHGYKGTFLDIGCSKPKEINNTYLLELNGWDGVSIDLLDYSKEWQSRKTKFVQLDALTCDYKPLGPDVIDYLSLDIEGEGHRFAALKRVIMSGLIFKCITIEHDIYRGYLHSEAEPQRELLTLSGYKLVKQNVSHKGLPFEDWWINPKYF
jgi:hypothetical protein